MMVHDTGASGLDREAPAPQPPSPDDWSTIWHSELAALAVDRECHERLFVWGQAWVTACDAQAGRTGPDAPPGASPPGSAPAPEFADELRRALAEFERRLRA